MYCATKLSSLPHSFLGKIVSLVLAWAVAFTSLTAYAAAASSSEPGRSWKLYDPPTSPGHDGSMPRAATAGAKKLVPGLSGAATRSTTQVASLLGPGAISPGPLLDPLLFPLNPLGSTTGREPFPFALQSAGFAPLQVSVGFADNSSASASFPSPWQGPNPLISFVGGGTAYRSGAIRLDNPNGTPLTIDRVTVDLGRPGPVFQLWQNVAVPAGGSAILAQTQDGNFNSSASPMVGCGAALAANETRIPKITVTIAGESTEYLDTAHVLDTGGFDSSCRGSQSLEWRAIGSAGPESPTGSVQLVSDGAPHAVGTQDILSV